MGVAHLSPSSRPTMFRLVRTLLSLQFVVLGLAGTTALGQGTTLQQRLAGTTSLSCTFSAKATGTWKDAVPGAEVAPAKVTVKFSDINVDEGTADATSALGGSHIVVRYSNDYLHLIQMHLSGPLYTTTVLAKETKDGRVMAIHTRHEYTAVSLPGFTSRPEMYIGDCALGE